MEKNNGKIAIAIVAMFVVALSVVGFTYAYFVARVEGNTADKSVSVTAGVLQVAYEYGNTIKFSSLVPGWVSDGKHYFDSNSYKVSAEDGLLMYTACEDGSTVDNDEVTAGTRNVACDDTKATETNGAIGPVTFDVTNNSTATNDTAHYAIILNGVTNELPNGTDGDEDPNNNPTNEQQQFKYKLVCKGCAPDSDDEDEQPDDVVVSGTQEDPWVVFPTTVKVISGVETLADNGDKKSYELSFEYIDTNAPQTNVVGKGVAATVEIVGIAQAEENGAWYDANGVEIIPATQQGN